MLLLPAIIVINTCNPTLRHSFFGFYFPNKNADTPSPEEAVFRIKTKLDGNFSHLDLLNEEWFPILTYLSSFLNYETMYMVSKHAWE